MALTSPASWTHSGHCDQYSGRVRSSHQQLTEAWEQLEVLPERQDELLRRISSEANSVWSNAIHTAETAIETAKEQTAETERRTAKLKADLSDEQFSSQAGADGCTEQPQSIKAKLQAAQDELQIWMERRNVRQQKFETLKGKCEQLRHQLGLAGSSVPVKTVTLYVLDGLAMELQNLQAEQEERQKRLDLRLKELRKHCMALGEDEGEVAARVHPSLGASRDAQSSAQDLSDKTFDGLRTAILDFQDLEKARSDQAEVLLNTLQSLWEAMKVSEDDLDRDIFTKLMQGSNRLHRKSHDKCKQEIERLEGARRDLMLTILEQKQQQISVICTTSHMNIPTFADFHPSEPGEISDALARTLKHLASVTSEAEDRRPLLETIHGLSVVLAESEWLAIYEDDPNKYKGRDSTRKIQRAIAASEQRKQLPSLIDTLAGALDTYRNEHGKQFMYDGAAYQSTVLPSLKEQVKAEEQKRSQGAKQKAQSSTMKAAKPPALTPRKGPKSGPILRSNTMAAKVGPATSKTPLTDRRRTEVYASHPSLPRTDSLSSARSDNENVSLTSRVNRLLTSNSSSPAVSRTTSNMSSVDVEGLTTSRIPPPKTAKKQEKQATKQKESDITNATLKMRTLNLEAIENDDASSNTERIPALHVSNHRRSVSR